MLIHEVHVRAGKQVFDEDGETLSIACGGFLSNSLRAKQNGDGCVLATTSHVIRRDVCFCQPPVSEPILLDTARAQVRNLVKGHVKHEHGARYEVADVLPRAK